MRAGRAGSATDRGAWANTNQIGRALGIRPTATGTRQLAVTPPEALESRLRAEGLGGQIRGGIIGAVRWRNAVGRAAQRRVPGRCSAQRRRASRASWGPIASAQPGR